MRDNLKFLILLRDPVRRFHSDFHHAKDAQWCDLYMNQTFSQIVQRIIQGGWQRFVGGTIGCPDRLEGSLYNGAIERWFSNFSPSQFTVVPWLFNVEPGIKGRPVRTVAESMWDIVGASPGVVNRGTAMNKR